MELETCIGKKVCSKIFISMFPGSTQFSGLLQGFGEISQSTQRGVVEIMAPVLIRLAAACLDPFARFLMAQSDAHVTPKKIYGL